MLENTWKFVPCDIRKVQECEICFVNVSNPEYIHVFPCNHRFCHLCLSDYVSSTIRDGGLISTAIGCPGFQCAYQLEDGIVLKSIPESADKQRYLQIIANSFVQVFISLALSLRL